MPWKIVATIFMTFGCSGCALLPGQRQQLDLLWARFAEVGPGRTADFVIPSGRYTVFLRQVPVGCLRRVDIARGGAEVAFGPPLNVLLVQKDLTGGTYHFDVSTYGGADCGWEIQTVLNSVPEGRPPPAPRLDIPHPAPVALSSKTTDQFEVPAVGVYRLQFNLGPTTCKHSYAVRLLGPGSILQTFGGGSSGGGASGSGSFMLTTGPWRVDFGTSCSWDATLSPATQGGGGAVGF